MKSVLFLAGWIFFAAAVQVNAGVNAYTSLHIFSVSSSQTNYDGADSVAGLTLSSNVLYGMARLRRHFQLRDHFQAERRRLRVYHALQFHQRRGRRKSRGRINTRRLR